VTRGSIARRCDPALIESAPERGRYRSAAWRRSAQIVGMFDIPRDVLDQARKLSAPQ
jgi:hypothetical protein